MLQLDAWEQTAALSGDLWGCLGNKAQDGWKSRGLQGDWLSYCSCHCLFQNSLRCELGDCAEPFAGELGFLRHPLVPDLCSDGCVKLVLFRRPFSPPEPGSVCC